MYRLHIDITLGEDEEKAIESASRIISSVGVHVKNRSREDTSITGMNYRLGHDDDRQKSNYLMKNEEGHVNNKKCRVTFNELSM